MKWSAAGVALLTVFLLFPGAAKIGASEKQEEALFNKHCAVCHPDGGNIINPKKTLKKADMLKNGIKTKDDIVRIMRKPGPGMSAFDEKTIPTKDAKEIAEYIIKKYGK